MLFQILKVLVIKERLAMYPKTMTFWLEAFLEFSNFFQVDMIIM